MKYLSLFSGIEAATMAWHGLGFEPVAFSEIEPFPCALLAHYYPDTPNLGDVSKITEDQVRALGRIDLVVFGSPCQDLSVSGKRQGFKDADGNTTRSGLFVDAINIIRWARQHCGCRFALWENVPGAFSSNKGADFARVVELMAGLRDVSRPKNGWGTEGAAVGDDGMLEWAVLDAQWFGLAQRRKRVFALADFGNWAGRPPILLERDSLRGDSAPSRGQGAVVAALTARGVGTCGADDNQAQDGHIIAFNPVQEGMAISSDVSAPIGASDGGGNQGCVVAFTARDDGHDAVFDFTPTMRSLAKGADGHQSGSAGLAVVSFGGNNTQGPIDVAACLNAKGGSGRFYFESETFVLTCSGKDVLGTLQSSCSDKHFLGNQEAFSGDYHVVTVSGYDIGHPRRLTPLECERLMGFPDNFTRIPFRKCSAEDCADSPRYKALGNSMAEPVIRNIGTGILAALREIA